jgi:iron complex outermembrane receptor protein
MMNDRGTSSRRIFAGIAGGFLVSTAMTTPASAQDDPQHGLADIIVTAQRTEGRLQDTPVSVALLSGEELATRGISDPAALQGSLPAVQFQPVGDVLANIRGIGTFNLQPGADAAIAYNVDDIYIAHATGLTPVFFDLARIEALRGPQGTLYGRNTNAGAINIITNRPRLGRLSAAAQVQAGNYDLIATEAMLNLPLGETVAVRISGATQKHDGYMRDGHNDADIYAGRIRLLFAPDQGTELLLTGEYSNQSGLGAGGSSPCLATFAVAGCNRKGWDAYAGNETPVPDDFRSVENIGINGQLAHDFTWATLTAIASWRRVDYASLTTTGDANIPFGDFGYKPSNANQLFTGEVRLNSLASSPVQWVVGAYYSREKMTNRIDRTFLSDTLLGVSEVLDRYRATSRALFGQVTVPLGSRIRLTGGLRFTDEEKSASGVAANYFVVPAASIATGGAESHSGLTWKAGIEADLARASLAYASVSTGFKSGGVNQTPAGFGIPSSYAPERITAYQAGVKNRFLDNKLQVNAEVFYYRYTGFQELLNSFAPGYLAFYTVNSQKARVYGGEVEVVAMPSPDDRFEASLALLDTRFTQFDLTSFGGADYSGNELRNAPPVTVNVAYQHRFRLGSAGELTPRIETVISDKYYTDAINSVAGQQASYTQTSASLRYLSANGGWSLTGWVRNLENEAVIYSYFGGRGYPLAPRTYGVTLRFETR